MSEAWRKLRERIDLDEYDARWDRMAEQGEQVHGEVDFLLGFGPSEVLDAGCGTGTGRHRARSPRCRRRRRGRRSGDAGPGPAAGAQADLDRGRPRRARPRADVRRRRDGRQHPAVRRPAVAPGRRRRLRPPPRARVGTSSPGPGCRRGGRASTSTTGGAPTSVWRPSSGSPRGTGTRGPRTPATPCPSTGCRDRRARPPDGLGRRAARRRGRAGTARRAAVADRRRLVARIEPLAAGLAAAGASAERPDRRVAAEPQRVGRADRRRGAAGRTDRRAEHPLPRRRAAPRAAAVGRRACWWPSTSSPGSASARSPPPPVRVGLATVVVVGGEAGRPGPGSGCAPWRGTTLDGDGTALPGTAAVRPADGVHDVGHDGLPQARRARPGRRRAPCARRRGGVRRPSRRSHARRPAAVRGVRVQLAAGGDRWAGPRRCSTSGSTPSTRPGPSPPRASRTTTPATTCCCG